jgi:hypothetical protein
MRTRATELVLTHPPGAICMASVIGPVAASVRMPGKVDGGPPVSFKVACG